MSRPSPRGMLAVVVATGAFGFAALASLLLLSPGPPAKPETEALPLRSVAVVPFAASGDPSLAGAASRLGDGVARALAEGMPQARVVAGPADDVRFLLEGEVAGADGETELTLRVVDARDGRVAGLARVPIGRALWREPDAAAREAAATARRIVTAAMLHAAAVD